MDRLIYKNIRSKCDFNKSSKRLYWCLGQNLIILGVCAWLWGQDYFVWMRLPAIPLISVFMFRNFSLMHDAVHGALHPNKKFNDVIGLIAGGCSLLPYEPWKKVHLEHHFWSGNVEKDPVMAIVTNYPRMPLALRWSLSFLWRLWFPIFAIMQHIVFWMTSLQVYFKKDRSTSLLSSLLFPLVLWAGLFSLLPFEFTAKILMPGVFLYLMVVEVVNLPHHLQLPQYVGDTRIPLWDQHQVARSCVYPKWFSELVVLNFNYHIEHHLFPDLPWHQLRKAHAYVHPELQSQYNSDPMFKWILKNRTRNLREVLAEKYHDSKVSAA